MTTIFNVLVFSLAVLPFGIRAIAEARIALKRVQVPDVLTIILSRCKIHMQDKKCMTGSFNFPYIPVEHTDSKSGIIAVAALSKETAKTISKKW